MRKAASIGIGAGAAAIVAMSAGVATAATGGQQAGGSAAAAARASVNKHITRHQAAVIARAKVPHSKVIEIESDDLHDRAVWKVQLHTARGRVTVDVDKKTGHATIVRRGGHHGPGDVRLGSRASTPATGASSTARADDRGRDARDEDAARDAAERRGDEARGAQARDRGDDHGRDGRHHHHDGRDHDRGDDGPGR
jgi:hypothetical protein